MQIYERSYLLVLSFSSEFSSKIKEYKMLTEMHIFFFFFFFFLSFGLATHPFGKALATVLLLFFSEQLEIAGYDYVRLEIGGK